MNNMVFYRKYRPQKIDELDNENVRQSLYSIFSKGSFAHAFLFTGPKGLGKTSAARIIAKVINCEKHRDLKGQRTEKEIEPCNKCEQCLSITNGNNLDIFEIDGASNRGIDEIRDLKEKIKLAPFKASKKIYIIDEVHMLTTEAFNALLKTLEEPPSHAVFILCTTEPHKVPATIASRCVKINFTRATNEELTRSMQRIVKAEEIKIEKEAVLEIAKLSDGSFRDAAKILEEIAVFAGRKTVTADLVNEKFNSLGISESLNQMIEVFIQKDAKKGLELCRELVKQGMDFKFFIEQLTDKLHVILLQKVGVEKIDKESPLSLLEIRRLFELLATAYQETKTAVLPQMPLELMILEWGEDGVDSESQSHAAQDAHQDSTQFQKQHRSLNESQQPTSKDGENAEKPAFSSFADGLSPAVNKSKNDFFSKLIDEVKLQNHLIAGVLRGCLAEDVQNGKLNIIAKSKFHKEKLEEVKTLKLLEDSADKILGEKLSIQIILGGDK
jgi:DNA polymerase-3 subunit gamma/tau